jgi:hypothetical protein
MPPTKFAAREKPRLGGTSGHARATNAHLIPDTPINPGGLPVFPHNNHWRQWTIAQVAQQSLSAQFSDMEERFSQLLEKP